MSRWIGKARSVCVCVCVCVCVYTHNQEGQTYAQEERKKLH
jgi:hypothetical protein